MNPSDQKAIEALTQAINHVYFDKKRLFLRSFLAGLFTALGATVGLSIFLLLVGFLVHWIGGIPVIGQDLAKFISEIIRKP